MCGPMADLGLKDLHPDSDDSPNFSSTPCIATLGLILDIISFLDYITYHTLLTLSDIKSKAHLDFEGFPLKLM